MFLSCKLRLSFYLFKPIYLLLTVCSTLYASSGERGVLDKAIHSMMFIETLLFLHFILVENKEKQGLAE